MVEGITEKHTGKDPFIAPANWSALFKEQRYDFFKDPGLGALPVNFLTRADTTGGNSGSAVMNKCREF